MKNKAIILILMISALFSQMNDKQSIVYDKAYVQEEFEDKYSGDWIKEDTLGVRKIGEFNYWLINGRLHLPYTTEQQRHDQISDWALSIIDTAIGNIFIEGYSFGSKGLVFNLAENMGTLKHKLYKLNKRFQSIVPGQIKKNATGKGNADKLKMYEQFTKDTGVDLVKEFEQTKLNNPVTDIVDSYYIAKYGYES